MHSSSGLALSGFHLVRWAIQADRSHCWELGFVAYYTIGSPHLETYTALVKVRRSSEEDQGLFLQNELV
jgi:hypothetical protein